MATYGQLQSLVEKIIIDLPTTVSAEVGALINAAQRELQRRHDFKVCEAVSSVFETVTETELLGSVPSDWHKWRGYPINIDVNGGVSDLGIANSRQDAEREWGSIQGGEHTIETMIGPPKILFIGEPTSEAGAASFYVRYIPDEESEYDDGNYRIQVPYWKFLTALSADGDTNWFTVNGEYAIAYLAAAEGFALDWDEERAAIWAQKAAIKVKEVIDLDKRLRFAQIDTLVPNPDAHGARVYTRR